MELYRGLGCNADPTEAFETDAAEAAEAGNPCAKHEVADAYLHGKGTALDKDTAESWFDAAGMAGIIDSKVALAEEMYLTPPDNMVRERHWRDRITTIRREGKQCGCPIRLAKSADAGGVGDIRDDRTAMEWLLKAALNGHEETAVGAPDLGIRPERESRESLDQGGEVADHPVSPRTYLTSGRVTGRDFAADRASSAWRVSSNETISAEKRPIVVAEMSRKHW